MVRKKVDSYLGFAAKSRSLVTGSNTCSLLIQKKKICLLIITEDVSANTKEKILKDAKRHNIKYRVYGNSSELSKLTGKQCCFVFGVTDRNFAEQIRQEIDKEQAKEQEVF